MGTISLKRMLDNEETLYAHCLNVDGLVRKPPCSHGATVDLGWLIGKVGDEVDLYSPAVQRLFVCKRCGGRGASFIAAVANWTTSSAGRDAREAAMRKKQGLVRGTDAAHISENPDLRSGPPSENRIVGGEVTLPKALPRHR